MNKRTLIQHLILNLALFILFSGCSSVFYRPSRYLYVHPKKLNLIHEEINFKASDQTPLHGWLFPADKKFKTPESFTVFLHGNAQNISAHYLNLKWMPAKGHSFFIFDYRGFGLSGILPEKNLIHNERTLKPNQQGVHKDAVAGLIRGYQLFKKSKAKKFIVYGQSLGGAIMMRALEDFPYRHEIDLVILDSTFRSYQKLAFHKLKSVWLFLPFSPLSFLLVSDEYASKNFINTNKHKTLVIHGTHDRIVPYQFGVKIYNQLVTDQKWFWTIKGGHHIDVFSDNHLKYRKMLDELIRTQI